MSYFTTTNNTYGAFYKDMQDKKRESATKVLQQQSKYSNQPQPKKAPSYLPKTQAPSTPSSKTSINDYLSSSKVGFINIGNSCYLNSILQILIHTPSFINKFLELSKNFPPCSTSSLFYETLLEIFQSNNKQITPINFANFFSDKHKTAMTKLRQQDSMEFYRIFIQDISSDLPDTDTSYSLSIQNNFNNYNNTTKKNNFFNYLKQLKNTDSSFLNDLLLGNYVYEINCKCGKTKYNFSQFADIPISLNQFLKDNNPYTNKYNNNLHYNIRQLLDNEFKDTSVQANEMCKYCDKCTKKCKIANLPEILVFSIQRASGDRVIKNEAEVEFDFSLDMSKYVDYELCSTKHCQYYLFGINYHVGTFQNGHYFSDIYVNGNWFRFDDEHISACKPDFVSSSVYGLFYMKIKN